MAYYESLNRVPMGQFGPKNAYIDTYESKCNDKSKLYVIIYIMQSTETKNHFHGKEKNMLRFRRQGYLHEVRAFGLPQFFSSQRTQLIFFVTSVK